MANPVSAGALGCSGAKPYNPPQELNHRRILTMPDDFVDYVMELFGPFGTIGARRMFGGHGLFLDGLMFAIVSGDTLYLKADEMNRIEFEQACCEIFSYARKGKRAKLNFFRAPEGAMESAELMLPWARTAYAAALRANAKKQVAGQVQVARRIAQQGAAKNTPPPKPAGKKAVKRKGAKPARLLKRGKAKR
ncbi:MAG: TfoX/Sxy family protein [Burkholderiales bacterium]